jgi:hypothetical protein
MLFMSLPPLTTSPRFPNTRTKTQQQVSESQGTENSMTAEEQNEWGLTISNLFQSGQITRDEIARLGIIGHTLLENENPAVFRLIKNSRIKVQHILNSAKTSELLDLLKNSKLGKEELDRAVIALLNSATRQSSVQLRDIFSRKLFAGG